MRVFIKIIIAVAAAAALAIIALAVFAKIIITPERVHEAVVPVAEQALNRSVQLGDISISFFSGIILHDLRIMEQDNTTVFLSAAQASLRYRFLPLLSLRVVIDELRLEQPHITVTRQPDGTFNFSDLLAAENEHVPATTRQERPPQSVGLPVSLTISSVRLNRGSIVVIDQAAGGAAAPLQQHISRLTVNARSITFDNAFPFQMECRINDAPLSVDGHLNIRTRSVRARIELTNLDARALLPYGAGLLPGRLSSLTANLTATIEADTTQIATSGTLGLSNISLLLNDLPDTPIDQAELSADFDLAADLPVCAVQVRSTRINYNGIIAHASGRIEQLDDTALLALDVRAPDLSIAAVLAALPAGLVSDASAMNPAGTVDIEARIEGSGDHGAELLTTARITLRDVQASLGSTRPTLNGALQLSGNRLISQDLVLTTAGSQAAIDLSAENLFSTPIKTTQRIKAERFDLDALLQPSTTETRDSAAQKASVPAGTNAPAEIGPFDLNIAADGTVTIARAVFRGLPINDFTCIYRLTDNILTIKKMSGNLAGGSFAQNARIDLGRPGLAYQSTLTLQGLQADPVLTAVIPAAAGIVFGRLNLDLTADGSGTRTETIKKNLTCATKLNLTDGRITAQGLTKGLADFLKLDELRELRFSSFGGTVNIAQGQALIDTEMKGDDIRMRPQGVVGLDGSLDLGLNASLSPALMRRLDKRARLAQVLTDDQGWSRLPITVGGSLEQPRFGLDAADLTEQVIDSLQQRLIERIVPQEKPAADSEIKPQRNLSRRAQPEPAPQTRPETKKERKKKQRQERREMLEDVLRDALDR